MQRVSSQTSADCDVFQHSINNIHSAVLFLVKRIASGLLLLSDVWCVLCAVVTSKTFFFFFGTYESIIMKLPFQKNSDGISWSFMCIAAAGIPVLFFGIVPNVCGISAVSILSSFYRGKSKSAAKFLLISNMALEISMTSLVSTHKLISLLVIHGWNNDQFCQQVCKKHAHVFHQGKLTQYFLCHFSSV